MKRIFLVMMFFACSGNIFVFADGPTEAQKQLIREYQERWRQGLEYVCNVDHIIQAQPDDIFYIEYEGVADVVIEDEQVQNLKEKLFGKTEDYINENSLKIIDSINTVFGERNIYYYQLTDKEKNKVIEGTKKAMQLLDSTRKELEEQIKRKNSVVSTKALSDGGFDSGLSRVSRDVFIQEVSQQGMQHLGACDRVVGIINQRGTFSVAYVGILNYDPVEYDIIGNIDGMGLASKGGNFSIRIK